MSDERSKEPTGETLAPTPAQSNGTAGSEGAEPAPRMDLPAWGQGKSKRRRRQPDEAGADAPVEGLPSLDAVDRGVAKVGRPVFNQVYLVVGGLVLVAGLVAGFQYWRGQGESESASSTRALAKGVAPLARGKVVPESEEMPKVANDPLARTQKELLDQAQTALGAAAATNDEAALSAQLAQASLAMRQGKPGDAVKSFAGFLASAKPTHPLRRAAMEGHALALEQNKDLEGALKQLGEMKSGSARLDWHRGRILAALGRKDEARTALEKASADPKSGLEARMAKSLLATLGKAPAANP